MSAAGKTKPAEQRSSGLYLKILYRLGLQQICSLNTEQLRGKFKAAVSFTAPQFSEGKLCLLGIGIYPLQCPALNSTYLSENT